MRNSCLAATLITVLMVPSLARAEGDDARPAAGAAQSGGSPDFLFSRPRVSVSIRGSWLLPAAGSDWFDFVTDQLTVDRTDFRSGGIAGEVGVAIAPKLDLMFAGDWSSRTVGSEYRDYVDNNRLPINQTTRLRQGGLTAGVRYTLTERGREVGTLAWIPHRFVPYVGGGGGVLWYEMLQFGDFVDIVDSAVFPDFFQSTGWTPVGHVNGGADVHLFRPIYVTFDARYQWAHAELSDPFVGFEPLDLGGLRLSTGLTVVF